MQSRDLTACSYVTTVSLSLIIPPVWRSTNVMLRCVQDSLENVARALEECLTRVSVCCCTSYGSRWHSTMHPSNTSLTARDRPTHCKSVLVLMELKVVRIVRLWSWVIELIVRALVTRSATLLSDEHID